MRSSLLFPTMVALLLCAVSVVPVARAESVAYPYFRRTGNIVRYYSAPAPAPVRTSVSYSSAPTVGVHLEADRNEANPGDSVRYWIRIKNLYSRDMPGWRIAFFYNPNQMQMVDAGGGRMEGDHVVFNVPAMPSGQEIQYSVRVQLSNGVRPGDVLTTYGSMIWDGAIQPACSRHDLRIISRPPVTGVGDATSPVERLSRFLRPM